MADITSKTADTSPTGSDLLYEVDVSDTTDNANGSDKKVTMANVVTKAHGLTGNELLKLSSNVMVAAAEGTDYYGVGGTDVAITDGGTGASTATAGFDALAPTTTAGDIIVRGASNNERLAIGSAQQFLAVNSGGTALEWVDGGSGGQTLYDHVVAASGGDYTTLQDALDACSNGDTIYVRSGTYALAANKTLAALTDITIIGENPTTSLISLVTYTLQFDGANITFLNVGFTGTTGSVLLNGAESSVSNCYIVGTAANTTPLVTMAGAYSKFVNNYCEGTANIDTFIKTTGTHCLVGSNVIKSTGNPATATCGLIFMTGTSNAAVGNVLTSGGTTTAGAYIYSTGQLNNITGNTMYPYQNSYKVKGIWLGGSGSFTVSGNYVYDCYDGIYTTSSSTTNINGNWVGEVGASRYQVYCGSANSNISGNVLQNPKTSGYGVAVVNADRVTISSNQIAGSAYCINYNSNSQYGTVTGNQIHASADNLIGIYLAGGQTNVSGNSITCATGTGAYGIFVNGNSYYNISGNQFTGLVSNAGTAIYFNSSATTNSIVSNNHIKSQYQGIYLQGSGHTVVGNVIDTIAASGASLQSGSEIVTMQNNIVYDSGVAAGDTYTLISESKVIRANNVSGGALAAGDIVTLYTGDGTGYKVTTTTTGGSPLVCGVAMEAISSNQNGFIKIQGKTVNLKVNGTTDIAIGDFISTFTTAGIGKKASAGETAIAIALEAYTADDSSGVIDAIIIPPRYV